MFELNTKRLKLIPLELKYFKMLLENVEETEKMLNLSISGEKMESYVKEAMESLYKGIGKSGKLYLVYKLANNFKRRKYFDRKCMF